MATSLDTRRSAELTRYPEVEIMTIFVPDLRELPAEQMAQLDPGAKFAVQRTEGRVCAYLYDWPDMRVVVNVTPDDERLDYLKQFVSWLEERSRSLGKALSAELAARILSTTIVLGFVVEKTTDREVWHDRVQDMIGVICFNTKSLVFWEGMIFDENCSQVWPSAA